MRDEGVLTFSGRRLWLAWLTSMLVLLAVLTVAPGARADGPVVNPGSDFQATVTGGSLVVGALDPIDVSEMAPPPRLKNVTVDEDGTLSAAAEDFVFPQLVFPIDAPIIGAVDAFIQLRAATAVTGSLDPVTGEVEINTSLTIQITTQHPIVALGNNCYVGSPGNPIAFHGVAGAAKGVPYDEMTGTLTLVDDELAIPAATGCPQVVGQDVQGMINDMLGLPSPSGSNEIALEMTFSPPPPHAGNWVDPGDPNDIQPVIVNDTEVNTENREGQPELLQRSWLETFSINGNDPTRGKFIASRKSNTVRVSLLVEHNPGQHVTGIRIDDDFNNNEDTEFFPVMDGDTAGATFTVEQPEVEGGFNYSRVNFEYPAPIDGMGLVCPIPVNIPPDNRSPVRDTIRDISVRAVLNNEAGTRQVDTLSSTSKIRLTRDDCDGAQEDAPMVYGWEAPEPSTELEPGDPVSFKFNIADTDEWPGLKVKAGGVNWRWRNLDTGAVTQPAKVCPGGIAGAMTVNTVAPSRGRWVAEAQLINIDNLNDWDCRQIELPRNWFWLAAVDVNSPQESDGLTSPMIGLSLPWRPAADGLLEIAASPALDPFDSLVGGKVQALEWDLDGDDTNGVDGFESVSLGNTFTGLEAEDKVREIDTSDLAPGTYPVRVRAGDNGALGAADNIRRTTVAAGEFMVNTPPVTGDVGKTTGYEQPVLVSLAASDTNADGSSDPLTWSLASGPQHGTLSGEWPDRTYRPDDGFSGTDSFGFRVDDGFGGSAEGTVTITVEPKATPPSGDLAPLKATFPEGRMNLNQEDGPSMSGVKVVDSTVPDDPVVFDTEFWDRTTGEINAPASDLTFPAKELTMSVTDPIPLNLEVKIEFGATGPITGSFNAATGALKLNLNAHALITITTGGGQASVMTCDVTPLPLTLDSNGPTLVDPGEAEESRPAKDWKAAAFTRPKREGAVTSLWDSLPASTPVEEPMAPAASCAGTLDGLLGGSGGIWLGGKVQIEESGGGNQPNTNPPNNATGIFDGKRLHVRLKCPPRFKPKCNMRAFPVAGKGKRAKVMAKNKIFKSVKSGKWVKVSFLIKPKFRQKVRNMAKTPKVKKLFVRMKVKSKKIRRKKFRVKAKTVHHRYKVRSAE